MGAQGKPFGKSFLSPGLVWGKFWTSRLWGEREGAIAMLTAPQSTRHPRPTTPMNSVRYRKSRGTDRRMPSLT